MNACNKNFLQAENLRNQANHQLYISIITCCVEISEQSTFIGHHLNFMTQECQQEIPSADTLIFDHDFAKRLFGGFYLDCLAKLAVVPVAERDRVLADMVGKVGIRRA